MRPDEEVVKAVLDGDAEAFAELVGQYAPLVRAAVLSTVTDRDAAEDVAQDAFLTAYRHLARLRDPAAFGGWLLRIARREAARQGRRKEQGTSRPPANEPTDPAEACWLSERSHLVLREVARLPRREGHVIMLRYFGDHSVAEIARMTARPVGTVTKQLSRARERLRRRLEWLV